MPNIQIKKHFYLRCLNVSSRHPIFGMSPQEGALAHRVTAPLVDLLFAFQVHKSLKVIYRP